MPEPMNQSNTRITRLVRMRRRRRKTQHGSANRIGRIVFLAFGGSTSLLLVSVLAIVFGTLGIYLYYARELPPPSRIEILQNDVSETTILYDRSGQMVLYEIVPPDVGDRQQVSIYDVPQYFLDATIAIEDASFYENPGFDVRGITRAMWSNLTGGQIQGGSSITQQLVKNVLIPEDERTDISADRKFKELILASEISRLYSKDQILEWYINTNFYGNLAYGIEAAAQVYFNKSARDLTLAEAALLAAIPQFPLQNPIDNPEAARLRQQLVLQRMVNTDKISQAEMDTALAEQIIVRPFGQRFEIQAPHFSLYARAEAEKLLNQQGLDGATLLTQGGLRIYTTLDFDLHQQLECVARTHVTRLDGAEATFVHNTNDGAPCVAANELPELDETLVGIDRTVTNASGVVLRAETGEILAMLGSVDFWDNGIDGNFNVATGQRQPASTFKPFVYITAFLNPLDPSTVVTPSTMLSDVYLEFNTGAPEPYVPLNEDRIYHGPISVREALANSYNVPVVQVLNWVGISQVLNTSHLMGINGLDGSLSDYGLSLALGASEVSLLDLTYAYNVFSTLGYAVGTPVNSSDARQGYRQLNPVSILRIEDRDGTVLWEFSRELGTFDRRPVIPPGMAYIMNDILDDDEARLEAFPRGNPLELSRPAAAKTGTTDDNRDSWTVGYTPEYTTGIWVGNNNNQSMNDISGISGAAPIWHAIMEYLHVRDALPDSSWERPNTVVEQTVCLWSGLLPTQNCPQVPAELFYVDPSRGVDYRPQQRDDMWYRLPVDVCNNTRANDTTPPQCVEDRIYFDFPEEFTEWATVNTPDLLPPSSEGVVSEDSLFSPIAIVSPRFPEQVGGTVEIFGNTNIEELTYFQLSYGVGNNPTSFIQIVEEGTERGFNQSLGVWETDGLDNGIYTLRLDVISEGNRVESTTTRITIDNAPPEIRLTSPLQAANYSASTDVVVNLQAEVLDVGGDIARVEFYMADPTNTDNPDILLGESDAFPYALPWAIEDERGNRTLWAVVYDRAGNDTRSASVSVQLID